MTDQELMSRALAIAERGRGAVEPNPLVGAVVARDGVVVAEGWHERFGGPHAEVNALRLAGEGARGATLYVTLEPCCHQGKTPPCTDAVLRAGIRRVVASMLDPYPAVAGQGVAILREAGVVVEVGLGGPAARRLNAPYITLLREKRPWIHAKWAMTLDGRIASFSRSSQWITSEAARAKVHQLRGMMDAIVVGRGTLLTDDPLLTARPSGPRVATRIVLTSGREPPPPDCKLLQTINEAPLLIATGDARHWTDWSRRGAEFVTLPGDDLIPQLLDELGRRRMTNVLVEGGSRVLGGFFDHDLIDEVHAFFAPKLVGGDQAVSPIGGRGIGMMSDARAVRELSVESVGPDVYLHGYLRDLAGDVPHAAR